MTGSTTVGCLRPHMPTAPEDSGSVKRTLQLQRLILIDQLRRSCVSRRLLPLRQRSTNAKDMATSELMSMTVCIMVASNRFAARTYAVVRTS